MSTKVRCLRAQFKSICQEARNRKEAIVAKCAFVTFFDQEGKERCLRMFTEKFTGYSFLSRSLNMLWKFSNIPLFEVDATYTTHSSTTASASLASESKNDNVENTNGRRGSVSSIKDGTRFEFVQAPDPEDIIWENLTTPTPIRYLKKFFTSSLIFMLMICSFAFIFSLTSYSRARGGNGASESRNGKNSCADYRYLFNETGYQIQLFGSGGSGIPIITKYDVMADEFPILYNSTSEVNYEGLLECYCEAVEEEGGVKLRNAVKMKPPHGKQKQYCKMYFEKLVKEQAVHFIVVAAASTTVMVVNLGLKYIYIYLIDFEGPASRTEKILSLTRKLTFAMFVNTACLTLILNGNLSWFTYGASKFDKFLLKVNVFVGENNDFGFKWYMTVGTSLVITMFMNMFAINFYKYGEWLSYKLFIFLDHAHCDRTCGKGNLYDDYRPATAPLLHRITNKTTQIQLDQLHEGPLFVIYDRYAGLVNTFFVCIMYSAGLPILILVLFATFFITYLIDKHTLLRIYKLPKALDSSVAISTTRSLKYAVYIHLFTAMWMYSNPDMFETRAQIEYEFNQYAASYVTTDGGIAVNTTEHVENAATSTSSYLNEGHWFISPKFVDSIGLTDFRLFNRFWFMFDNIDVYFAIIMLVISISLFTRILPVLGFWLPCLSKMGIVSSNNRLEIKRVAKDIMKRNTARKTVLTGVSNNLTSPPRGSVATPLKMDEHKSATIGGEDEERISEVKTDSSPPVTTVKRPTTLPPIQVDLPAPSTHRYNRMNAMSPDHFDSEERASQYHRMQEISPDDGKFLDPGATLKTTKRRHSSKKWVQFGQWYHHTHAPLDALSSVSWHDDVKNCTHSKLRNHIAYGHSGEGIGEGLPDYFHAISRTELEAQIAARIIKGNILRSYKSELEWRNKNPERAIASKQIIGLCSYDYQLDPEYKKLYALDSKSYYRFQAGKLDVTDADYLLRQRGLFRRMIGYLLDLNIITKKQDPTSIFPDPPVFEHNKKFNVVSIHPKCIHGPKVVLNLKVPDAAVHAMAAFHDNEKLLDEIEETINLHLDVPGIGFLNVFLPNGLQRLGVPEIQIEIPCVEITDSAKSGKGTTAAGDGSFASFNKMMNERKEKSYFYCCFCNCCIKLKYCCCCCFYGCYWCLLWLLKCMNTIIYYCFCGCFISESDQQMMDGWEQELESVAENVFNQDSVTIDSRDSFKEIEMNVMQDRQETEDRTDIQSRFRSESSSFKMPFHEFSRSDLDDFLDMEIERIELGPPQMQTFLAKAPKENMIPVVVDSNTKLWCRWPPDAKEDDPLKFELPAVSSHHLRQGNHFSFMSANRKEKQDSLFSPGWCLFSNHIDDDDDDDGKQQKGVVAKRLFENSILPDPRESINEDKSDQRELTYYQIISYARKPLIKDFQDLSQTPLKLPGGDIAVMAIHQQHQKPDIEAEKRIRVRVPTCRDMPLDRQQRRIDIPGVGIDVPIEILASDVVVVPGLHGRPIHAHAFLPWQSWWDDDPLVTQQAVPQVDEIFFDYPCVEPSISSSTEKVRTVKKCVGVDSPKKPCEMSESPQTIDLAEKTEKPARRSSIDREQVLPSRDHFDQLKEDVIYQRKLSAQWASRKQNISYAAGTPVFLETMQIEADVATVKASNQGKFQLMKEVPSIGDVQLLLPPDSRVKNTKLKFEFPTVKSMKVSGLIKNERKFAKLVDTYNEESCCCLCGLSRNSTDPLRNQPSSPPSSFSLHSTQATAPKGMAPRRSTRKEGLGEALRKLQEEHEALMNGDDEFRKNELFDMFCSLCCCCQSAFHPHQANHQAATQNSTESSDRTRVDEIIESSIIDDAGHQPLQVGWVILPLSTSSSPQVYLMLPAMVEYKQVLKAMIRSHGLLNPKFDTPPNPPATETPVKYKLNVHEHTPHSRLSNSSSASEHSSENSDGEGLNQSRHSLSTIASSDGDDEIDLDPAYTVSDLEIFSLTNEVIKTDHALLKRTSPFKQDHFGQIETYENSEESDLVEKFEEHLCVIKKKSVLGIEFHRETSTGYLFVKSIVANSGADKAKLQAGDRIVSVNNQDCDFYDSESNLVGENEIVSILQHMLSGECQAQIVIPPFTKPNAILHVSIPLMDANKDTDRQQLEIKNRNIKVRVPRGAKPGDTVEFTVSNVDSCNDLEVIVERKRVLTNREKRKLAKKQKKQKMAVGSLETPCIDEEEKEDGKLDSKTLKLKNVKLKTSPMSMFARSPRHLLNKQQSLRNSVESLQSDSESSSSYDSESDEEGRQTLGSVSRDLEEEEDLNSSVLQNPLMFGSPRGSKRDARMSEDLRASENAKPVKRSTKMLDCQYVIFDGLNTVNIGLKLGKFENHNLVTNVVEGSLSEKHGLQAGDRITQLNGIAVSSSSASSGATSSSSLLSKSFNFSENKDCLGYKLAKLLKSKSKVTLQVMREQPIATSTSPTATVLGSDLIDTEIDTDYDVVQHLNEIAGIKEVDESPDKVTTEQHREEFTSNKQAGTEKKKKVFIDTSAQEKDYDKEAKRIVDLVLPALCNGINIMGYHRFYEDIVSSSQNKSEHESDNSKMDKPSERKFEANLLQVERFNDYKNVLIWKAQYNDSNSTMTGRSGVGRRRARRKRRANINTRQRVSNMGIFSRKESLENKKPFCICLCALEQVVTEVQTMGMNKSTVGDEFAGQEIPCSNEFTLVFSSPPLTDLSESHCCLGTANQDVKSPGSFPPSKNMFELNFVCETVEHCDWLVRCFAILSYQALAKKEQNSSSPHRDAYIYSLNHVSTTQKQDFEHSTSMVTTRKQQLHRDLFVSSLPVTTQESPVPTSSLSSPLSKDTRNVTSRGKCKSDNDSFLFGNLTAMNKISSSSSLHELQEGAEEDVTTLSVEMSRIETRLKEARMEKEASELAFIKASELSALYEETVKANQSAFDKGKKRLYLEEELEGDTKVSPVSEALELSQKFKSLFNKQEENNEKKSESAYLLRASSSIGDTEEEQEASSKVEQSTKCVSLSPPRKNLSVDLFQEVDEAEHPNSPHNKENTTFSSLPGGKALLIQKENHHLELLPTSRTLHVTEEVSNDVSIEVTVKEKVTVPPGEKKQVKVRQPAQTRSTQLRAAAIAKNISEKKGEPNQKVQKNKAKGKRTTWL